MEKTGRRDGSQSRGGERVLSGGQNARLSSLDRSSFVVSEARPIALLLAAGFAVGAGARLAGGCTSGHGVCGIGRLSARSITATSIFVFVGGLTVFVSRHIFAGIQ
jgi:uncharacterized membrane protein YedE/YeeE